MFNKFEFVESAIPALMLILISYAYPAWVLYLMIWLFAFYKMLTKEDIRDDMEDEEKHMKWFALFVFFMVVLFYPILIAKSLFDEYKKNKKLKK